jgi:hypothetical protein
MHKELNTFITKKYFLVKSRILKYCREWSTAFIKKTNTCVFGFRERRQTDVLLL